MITTFGEEGQLYYTKLDEILTVELDEGNIIIMIVL